MWRGLGLLCLSVLGLGAQDPAYFKEDVAPWWRPEWELRLQGDRVRQDGSPETLHTRGGGRLRLRWTQGWAWGRLVVGSRHAVGSDGNRNNSVRYDQEPSNGSRVDTARLDLFHHAEATTVEVRLGLQDNPLLSQESLWDHDLVLTGASLAAGFRREEAGLVELGVRAVAGRVRTLPPGGADLAAVQGVVRLETGPLGWTLHAGTWDLRWKAGEHRLRPQDLYAPGAEQRARFEVGGLGLQWQGPVPVEVKGIRHRNRDNGQDGEEFQAWIGSRTRPWRPQAGFVYQRYEALGTAYAVNGDEWWFVAGAKGPRYLLALSLPNRWLVLASHLRHSRLDGTATFTRTQLSLTKRF